MTRDRDGRTGDLGTTAEPRRILAGLVRRIRGRDPEPGNRRLGERVHLYLDVSGSVDSLLGELCAAARDVAHLVWRDVHLFSTGVADVPMRDLGKGVCQTTGGTSLAPVARHIRDNRVRRAVIVTDGEVGFVNARDRETLGETILGVALTNGRERSGELARLARHVAVLHGFAAPERAQRPGEPPGAAKEEGQR